MAPTFFITVGVTTFLRSWTVVTPVSSALKIRSAANRYVYLGHLTSFGNKFCRHIRWILPIDVGSAARIESLCLFFNPIHHCLPAFLFSFQESERSLLFATQTRKPNPYIFQKTNQNTFEPGRLAYMGSRIFFHFQRKKILFNASGFITNCTFSVQPLFLNESA